MYKKENIQAEDENSNICLVLNTGIPGSGKTTFSKDFKSHLLTIDDLAFEEKPIIFACSHVEFDNIEMELKGVYTKTREIANVEEFSIAIWRDARKQAFQNVLDLIKSIGNSKKEEGPQSLKSGMNSCTRTIFVIIIDDNNYFSSMRKKYYDICTDFKLGYLELYFPNNIEKSIENNKKRDKCLQVEEEIIIKMAEKLEKSNYPDKAFYIPDKILLSKEIYAELVRKILHCCRNPPKSHKLTEEEINQRNKDRELTLESFFHQLDIAVRRKIGEFATSIQSIQNKQLKGRIMKDVSQIKCNYMLRIKQLMQNGEKQMGEKSQHPIFITENELVLLLDNEDILICIQEISELFMRELNEYKSVQI